MFLFGVTQKEGWFFNNFHVYQRVNEDVYCYVSKYIGFYVLQLYERSTTGLCTLEARSHTPEILFQLGEEWLQTHQEWNEGKIRKDRFYIGQMNWKERCWV